MLPWGPLFLLSCFQVTKNFNHMKDTIFWRLAAKGEPLCCFTTFWAITVIWLKWKAGIFLTRALSRDSGSPSLHDVYPGPLIRWCVDDRSCEGSASRGDKTVFLSIFCVEFPSGIIPVKSRASYIGCWVAVWPYLDHSIYLSPWIPTRLYSPNQGITAISLNCF